MLSDLDVYQLSRGASDLRVVIKDGALEDIVEQVYADVQVLRARLKPASMGGAESKWSSAAFRADETCWVTPELCAELGLQGLAQFAKRMIKETKPLHAALGFSKPDFSVQFAVYPAASAGYTRHLDARPPPAAAAAAACKPTRKITVLYYLNKHCDGGELRVFREGAAADEARLRPGTDFLDLQPRFSRACVFRSDLVEHAVQPCGFERLALTFWLSGVCKEGASAPTPPPLDPPPLAPPPTKRPGGPPPLPLPACLPLPAPSIFVSVACFRDSECQHTLRDLFLSAALPARVFVGVVWQGDPDLDRHCFRHFYGPTSGFTGAAAAAGAAPEWPREAEERAWWVSNVRTVEMHHSQARGPCPARSLAQGLWRGERYFLQVDAHMRFRDNWDAYLVQLLEETRRGLPAGRRPVLTTYPLGYDLPDCVPCDTRATLLVPVRFGDDGMLRQVGSVVVPARGAFEQDLARPLPSLLWAAGFSFSDACLLREVPYVPLPRLFFGEEQIMAVRLFTHGFDCFAPPQAVVYHLWSRGHRPGTGPEAQRERQQSLRRVRCLLGAPGSAQGGEGGLEGEVRDRGGEGGLEGEGDASLGALGLGLGVTRGLGELEALLGLSFAEATLSPEARADCLRRAPGWVFADDAELCDRLGLAVGQPPPPPLPPQGGLGSDVSSRLAALDLVMQFVNRSGSPK